MENSTRGIMPQLTCYAVWLGYAAMLDGQERFRIRQWQGLSWWLRLSGLEGPQKVVWYD